MKVPRHVKVAFDEVVAYMNLTDAEIAECKAEFEEDPDWGLTFYPRAAAIIRAASGLMTHMDQERQK